MIVVLFSCFSYYPFLISVLRSFFPWNINICCSVQFRNLLWVNEPLCLWNPVLVLNWCWCQLKSINSSLQRTDLSIPSRSWLESHVVTSLYASLQQQWRTACVYSCCSQLHQHRNMTFDLRNSNCICLYFHKSNKGFTWLKGVSWTAVRPTNHVLRGQQTEYWLTQHY